VDFMGSNIKGEIFFKDLTCFCCFFFKIILGGLEMGNQNFGQQINGENMRTLSMLNQYFIRGQ
jgi:hypothetical protein